MQGGWVATKSRGREVSERSFCRKFVGLFVWWEGLNIEQTFGQEQEREKYSNKMTSAATECLEIFSIVQNLPECPLWRLVWEACLHISMVKGHTGRQGARKGNNVKDKRRCAALTTPEVVSSVSGCLMVLSGLGHNWMVFESSCCLYIFNVFARVTLSCIPENRAWLL